MPGGCLRANWGIWGGGGQARKRHININFFVRLVLGRPQVCPGDFTGLVPGTNPVKTWDTPGFSPGLSLGQARLSRGRRVAQKVYVKKVYVPFSLARGGAKYFFRDGNVHQEIHMLYVCTDR